MSMNDMRGLWRGKRTDNGEWIEGYYSEFEIAKKAIPCIIPFSPLTNVFPDNGVYQVNPSTLGECTGLRDKNGTLIFEGDILSEKPPMNNVDYVGCVKYDERLTAFRIVFDNSNVLHILGSYSTSYTVIGNIHDTPELLKGVENNGSRG